MPYRLAVDAESARSLPIQNFGSGYEGEASTDHDCPSYIILVFVDICNLRNRSHKELLTQAAVFGLQSGDRLAHENEDMAVRDVMNKRK